MYEKNIVWWLISSYINIVIFFCGKLGTIIHCYPYNFKGTWREQKIQNRPLDYIDYAKKCNVPMYVPNIFIIKKYIKNWNLHDGDVTMANGRQRSLESVSAYSTLTHTRASGKARFRHVRSVHRYSFRAVLDNSIQSRHTETDVDIWNWRWYSKSSYRYRCWYLKLMLKFEGIIQKLCFEVK